MRSGKDDIGLAPGSATASRGWKLSGVETPLEPQVIEHRRETDSREPQIEAQLAGVLLDARQQAAEQGHVSAIRLIVHLKTTQALGTSGVRS